MSFASRLLAVSSLALVTSAPLLASAQIAPAPTAPVQGSLGTAAAVEASKDTAAPPPVATEPTHKQITIDVNPLSFLIGRYGPNLQYLPVPHHAIVLNPHFVNLNPTVSSRSCDAAGCRESTYEQNFRGFATELGYRFYTANHGAAGFFVGPSLILGTYTAKTTNTEAVSFNSIGYAIDIGGQAVLGSGFTIGGGFGMQYTRVNKEFFDLPLTAAVVAGGGWRPRFLLSFGYSFG